MRLLIVDDSALMRTLLTECFETEPDVEIVTARDGQDALRKFEQTRPDVVTLDINMPEMDGLTCLAHMMDIERVPVVMVSSLTTRGALASFEALELGATDFVAKPGGTVSHNMREIFAELRAKVRTAAQARTRAVPSARVRPSLRRSATAARPARRSSAQIDLVLIGVSTGGPGVLGRILGALPEDFPAPILIAQHMPPRFTKVFAERLDATCALRVEELVKAAPLQPGTAHVVSGSGDAEVTMRFNRLAATPKPASPRYPWHPSVSRMVASAMDTIAPERIIGVQLTGMGDDGAREFAALHDGGGLTIAESEDSAVVFGMPQKLIEYGGATAVLHADEIAAKLIEWTAGSAARRHARCP